MIILIITVIILFAIALGHVINTSYNPKLVSLALAIPIAIFILVGIPIDVSYTHGNYVPWYKIDLTTLTQNNDNSPVDQSSEAERNQDFTSNIYLVYRYGCTDCNKSHQDLEQYKTTMENNGWNVYWVSVRSHFGDELKNTYNIDEVPTVIVKPQTGTTQVIPARVFMSDGSVNLEKLPTERP